MADSGWSLSLRICTVGIVLALNATAQEKPLPDAQIESNVLKALAGVPELADQAIGTTTVYGTVTITGSVRDEASRDKAEQVIAKTPGVKKVVDELAIGVPATDETIPTQNQAPAMPQDIDASASAAPPQDAPRVSQPAPVERSQAPANPAPPYPAQRPDGVYAATQPRRLQEAGQPITLPVGTYLRVRVNQAINSRHTPPGTVFDGVVLNDITLNGSIAVPRGAEVHGQVVTAQPGGDFRGRGGLALELNQITLEGRSYPVATELWTHQGYDKTGQTVNTTVGLGAFGAVIGGIAGGGAGALLGAGLGSVAGLGVSSVNHQGDATMPAEAIANFRLSQQATVNTVSTAELDRLSATMPPPNGDPQQAPQMRRRSYPPPPPPYGYGPAIYPYPYYTPYYYR